MNANPRNLTEVRPGETKRISLGYSTGKPWGTSVNLASFKLQADFVVNAAYSSNSYPESYQPRPGVLPPNCKVYTLLIDTSEGRQPPNDQASEPKRGFPQPEAGATSWLDLGQGVKMELCGIPPGEFMMGSTKVEREWAAGPEGSGGGGRFENEGEVPRLTRITNGFWMGRTEVTVGQWKRFVAESGYQTDAEKAGQAYCFDWDKNNWDWLRGKCWRDPNYGFAVRDEHPVACISWNDAVAFCRWLTEKERAAGLLKAGLEVRLPAEAEWEYACRGGRAGTKFWWGDSVAEGQGRLNAASDDKPGYWLADFRGPKFPWSDGYACVSPADAFGAKGRNGFGLADMLGNVWEWCLDGYDEKGAHEDVWTGQTGWRVLRGCSFYDAPGCVRCAFRSGTHPSCANANGGFRVVLGVVR